MQLLLPDASLRSPTAVPGRSDIRDENIYSAIVLQHGGAGQQQLFTVPRGQAIPRLAGAGITVPTSNHQVNYTELTTNIMQSGQLGSSIGEASVRAIGLNIENAYVAGSQHGAATAGDLNTYGAGQQEINEILGKCFFQFRVAGKLQNQGPAAFYPASGGAIGAISSTGNSVVASALSNGLPGSTRRLKAPILIARTDTVEGTVGVAGGDALVFSVTSGIGQPVLLWCNLFAAVKGDAR